MPSRDPGETPRSETHDLVERVRAGDRARLEDLYGRLAPSIYAWSALRLRGALGRYLQREDLVQEVWLRALCAFPTYDPKIAPFRRWIYGIVHNVTREALYTVARRAPKAGSVRQEGSTVFNLEDLPDEITSLTQRVVREQGIKRFMERVESLDPADRDLVSLRGLEGLSFRDVARCLGVSEAAARKRWERLRAKLAASGPPDGVFEDSE